MVDLFPVIRLAQSILKRKFPSVDKPLQKQAPQKGPLKNISAGAYFRNFTVIQKEIFVQPETGKKNCCETLPNTTRFSTPSLLHTI